MGLEKKYILIISFVLALGVTFVYYGISSSEPHGETKTAVVVLDGSDWKPVNQLIEEERLPEIERIIEEEGVHGDLHTPSSFSPVEWTTVATGREQSNLNVDDWNTENEDGQQRMVRREDVSHYRMWDYLNEGGYKTGVVSWLLTWPVEEVDGFMVSGPMRTSSQNIAYPEEEFSNEEIDIIRDGSEWQEAEMALQRKEEVDFLALGMKNLDVIQHHLWRFVDPEPFGLEMRDEDEEYREIVYTEYENLDTVLGEFDENWNVLVFGTSGFRPENEERGFVEPSYALPTNQLVEKLGYGSFEQQRVRGTEIDRPSEDTEFERCPLPYGLTDVVNKTVMRFNICILDEEADTEQFKQDIKDITYRDGRPLVRDIGYNEETDSLVGYMNIFRDQIVEEEFRMAPTDQPLVDGNMPYIDPALGIVMPNGTETKFWIGPEKNGDHPPDTDSIFLAKGPDIKEGYELEEGTIHSYDIAPTVLYMNDLPIPEEMEGEPVKDLFKEEFNSQREPVYENVSTYKEDSAYTVDSDELREEALKERLRDIGYLVE